jgi:hypothetical protein
VDLGESLGEGTLSGSNANAGLGGERSRRDSGNPGSCKECQTNVSV